MSKRQLIILFGALIIIIALFSGLPSAWNTVLYVVIGLLIIAVAYTTTKPAHLSSSKPDSAPYIDAHGPSTPEPTTPASSNASAENPTA